MFNKLVPRTMQRFCIASGYFWSMEKWPCNRSGFLMEAMHAPQWEWSFKIGDLLFV